VWWIEELTSDVSIGLITAISGRPDGNHGSANVTFSLRNVSILYEVPSYTDLHDLETKAVDGLRAELESERARYIGRARSEIQTVAAQLPNESYWLKTTQQRMQKRTD
jgi:hypothetical protein